VTANRNRALSDDLTMLIAYGEPYTAVFKKNRVKNNRKVFSWMPEIEDILVSYLEIRCLNRYQFGKLFDEN
jgi:hypothetical protein